MEAFWKYVRERFILPDLIHLADSDNDALKLLMFQKGPCRNEFIKFFVYKLLLDIEPKSEDSEEHNLENIFVSFGLLNEEEAQQFLKGILTTKAHIDTWMRIIEALIPITKIEQSSNVNNYDEMMHYIYEKNLQFQSVVKKNYLPPELIPKLKVQTAFNESSESIEDIYNELTKIIKKPIRSDEQNYDKSCDSEKPSNHKNPKLMDLTSIKREIDQYIQISSENEIVSFDDIQLNRKSLQDCYENNNLDAKVDNILKLVKAENDLQILVNSLVDQV